GNQDGQIVLSSIVIKIKDLAGKQNHAIHLHVVQKICGYQADLLVMIGSKNFDEKVHCLAGDLEHGGSFVLLILKNISLDHYSLVFKLLQIELVGDGKG